MAQVNIRQMQIKEAEVYADSFADNYELRVFSINSLTDKTPFGKIVDILN